MVELIRFMKSYGQVSKVSNYDSCSAMSDSVTCQALMELKAGGGGDDRG